MPSLQKMKTCQKKIAKKNSNYQMKKIANAQKKTVP